MRFYDTDFSLNWLLTLNSDRNVNGSLVFHLVDVNPGIGPFAIVVGNVCLDSLFQLFDDFQGGAV